MPGASRFQASVAHFFCISTPLLLPRRCIFAILQTLTSTLPLYSNALVFTMPRSSACTLVRSYSSHFNFSRLSCAFVPHTARTIVLSPPPFDVLPQSCNPAISLSQAMLQRSCDAVLSSSRAVSPDFHAPALSRYPRFSHHHNHALPRYRAIVLS